MSLTAHRATFSQRSLRKSLKAYPGRNENFVLVTCHAARLFIAAAKSGVNLTALADADDPTDAIRTLDRITCKQVAPKRTAKAFNPLARDETQIFRALLDGQHMIRGFSNPDIRQKLKRLAVPEKTSPIRVVKAPR